jgi:starch-binding outer membrane protein, SusD/RagB family
MKKLKCLSGIECKIFFASLYLKIRFNNLPLPLIKTSSFLILTLALNSCKKFVVVPPPQTELVTASVFNNSSSATSAQTAIYTQIWSNAESYYQASVMGLYADELQNYSMDQSQVQIYTNALTANSANFTNGLNGNASWANVYNYIYQVNAVISGLQANAGISVHIKQQLTGEAYFIRAFWHFYLSNVYGDVPLVLTTSYAINGKISRTPRLQVLQQVVDDLTTAESLLNLNYVDITDTAATTERVRPNKAVAQALLARAYLYLGDYSNAATYYAKADSVSTSLIGNSNYSLTSLNDVFLTNSSEAIWQLQTPTNQSSDTEDGYNFILLGAPSTSGSVRSSTISQELLNSFEPNDQRKNSWIDSVTEGTNTYYFPYKYKNNSYQGTEYNTVLRLGEQYLIRAEAEAEEGKTSNAIVDLNTIRSRAGIPDYAGVTDQESILTAIMHERQVELFTEWGARWFDLCRSGNVNSVMGSPGNVCHAKGGTWNSNGYQLLFPIPQAERITDYNLSQNPGY